MERDATKMRGDGPTVFAQVKNGVGVDDDRAGSARDVAPGDDKRRHPINASKKKGGEFSLAALDLTLSP